MKSNSSLIPVIFLLGIVFCMFWQFFLKGLHPFPGNYLLAWFEPWHTQYSVGGTIILAHKAIASDVFRQFYPFKVLAFEMFHSLQWPLWNPYNGAGQPFLATNNIGLLDPFNILYFFMPAPFAWSIYIILQAAIIGLCTYLFARKIGLSLFASLIASVIFLLSGAVMVRFIYSIFGLAFAMLPFMLYLIEDFLQTKSKKIYLLPFAVYLTIISTLPQIAFYVLGLIFVYGILRIKSFVSWFLFLGFLVLGLGLAAIQLLPTLELYLHANITAASSQFIFQRFLMSPSHLLTLLIPNFFGSDSTYNFWEQTDYVETLAHMGTIPIFLAIVGAFRPHRGETSIEVSPLLRLRIFLVWTILITIFLTLDSPITRFLYSLPIPLTSTGIPTRIYLLTTFAIAVLAGMGLDQLTHVNREGKTMNMRLMSIFSLLLAIILSVVAYQYVRHIPCPDHVILYCRQVTFRNTLLELGVFSLFALCTMLFALRFNTYAIRHKLFALCTLLLITTIGIYNAQKFLPWSPQNSFLPQNPVISEIQKHTDGRVLGFDTAGIQTDFATYFHYYDPNYYHPLYIKRYGELVAYGNSDSNHPYELLRSDVNINNHATVSASFANQRARLMDLLSIKYMLFKKSDLPIDVARPNSVVAWQNSNFYMTTSNTSLPHAYFVSRSVTETSDKAVLQKLFDPFFDPHETVVFKGSQAGETATFATGLAMITQTKENSLTVSVSASGSGFVVLTDNMYPGWKAYVDGKEVPIQEANYTFRAVPVTAGKHTVTFIYDPRSFKIGLGISALSLVLLMALYMQSLSRRRKPR